MGVEIVIYRTAIGLFHAATHRSFYLPRSVFDFRLQLQSAFAAFVLLFSCSFLKKDEFIFYRIVLLLMCMDVHPNPGPSTSETHTLDIFKP